MHSIARRHRAAITYYPIDFGLVFPATGGLPLPKRAPARQAYRLAELRRWKAHLGADDFNVKPKYFPVDRRQSELMAIVARDRGEPLDGFCRAVLSAAWCEERDISDRETLVDIATAQGFDGAALLTASDDAAPARRYEADSKAAIDRGVFGAPFFIVGDESLWGQDRLDFLDRLLAAA